MRVKQTLNQEETVKMRQQIKRRERYLLYICKTLVEVLWEYVPPYQIHIALEEEKCTTLTYKTES